MARRAPWASALRRTLNALNRAGTRAVVKATKQALRASLPAAPKKRPARVARVTAKRAVGRVAEPAAARSAKAPPRWLTGIATSALGARRYRLCKPPGARRNEPLPLLVLLHGCTQDAAQIARSTHVQRLADREGFIVLCPEQDRLANAHHCWNWFELRNGRALAEVALIDAAIDQACVLHGADPQRVVVAGFSAGAGMAGLLAARRPQRFAAVAMHSGVVPGVAQSAASALRAMQGGGRAAALPTGVTLPPLLVIQGDADRVVAPNNGRGAASAWAEAMGARARPARVLRRGQRRASTLTDYAIGKRIAVTLCEVQGLAHAWSGGAAGQPWSDPTGPDAMRMIWAFATRALTARAAAP